MIRCYVTDRLAIGGVDAVVETARRIAHRVDWIQVREKDLPGRALFLLVTRLMQLGPRIIVNSRADIAVAAKAHGVHLPGGSIAAGVWRRVIPADALIGVSCHSVEEAERAEAEGASYVILSPIFRPLSKPGYGPPLGIASLSAVARRLSIPVLALGGITESNQRECMEAGAAGFAAITSFQGGE